MSAFDISSWALGIRGKSLDLDGAPARNPVQCHDVWLSYLYALGGKPGDGYAPGNGYTHQVWNYFPVTQNVGRLFTKHAGVKGIRRGDVIFWLSYVEGGGLPHVAVALDPPKNGRVRVCDQDAGKSVNIRYLSTQGVLGYLRPKQAIKAKTGTGARPGNAKSPEGEIMSWFKNKSDMLTQIANAVVRAPVLTGLGTRDKNGKLKKENLAQSIRRGHTIGRQNRTKLNRIEAKQNALMKELAKNKSLGIDVAAIEKSAAAEAREAGAADTE